MKMKNVAALLLTMCLSVPAYACSASDSSTIAIQTDSYALEIPAQMTRSDGDNQVYTGGSFEWFRYHETIEFITAKGFAEYVFSETLKDDANATMEHFDHPQTDCYVITYLDAEENQFVRSFYYFNESRCLELTAVYDEKKQKKALTELDEIAKSVQFTSDYRLDSEPTSFDCDYFSVNYGDKYIERKKNTDLTEDNAVSISFGYRMAEKIEQTFAPSLSIAVMQNGGRKKASEYAEEQFQKTSKTKQDDQAPPVLESGSILGFHADCITSGLSLMDMQLQRKQFFFDCNDAVYQIAVLTQKELQQDADDITELLNNVTIKQLSADIVEQKKQERESVRFADYTSKFFTFTVDARFQPSGKIDENKSYLNLNDFPNYIHMSDEYCMGSFAEMIEKRVAELEADGITPTQDTYSTERYTFTTLSHPETDTTLHSNKLITEFYFEANDEAYSIMVGYNEDTADDVFTIVYDMLDTLQVRPQ